MKTTINQSLNWVTIPLWHSASLVGFKGTIGLFRALLGGKTMFIGCSTTSTSGLGARLDALRKPNGSGQRHFAGRQVFKHRMNIEMQIAVMDLPASRILQLRDELVEELRPPWRVPEKWYPR